MVNPGEKDMGYDKIRREEQRMDLGRLTPAGLAGLWLGLSNLLAFALMGLDKRRARQGGRRIAELTFFSLALLGGSVGAIGGMYAFRHKTRHWYFRYGLPAILAGQLFFLWFGRSCGAALP